MADDVKERVRKILRVLKKEYPEARCLLDHEDPLQLLVATILAAQCTDERVNIATKALFAKLVSAEDFAQVPQAKLEEMIRSTGFFRNKAKAIRAACAEIAQKHGGEVPANMEALVALPGVGRKTANVVLATCFGKQGIIVDTHLSRVTQRIGLTREKDPVKMELALQKVVPKGSWTRFSHVIGFHGRQVCHARRPACETCHIRRWCAYGGSLLAAEAAESAERIDGSARRRGGETSGGEGPRSSFAKATELKKTRKGTKRR